MRMRNRLREVKWLAQAYTGGWGRRQVLLPTLVNRNEVNFLQDYAISFEIFLYISAVSANP